MRDSHAKALQGLADDFGFSISLEEAQLYHEAMDSLEREMAEFLDADEDRPAPPTTARDPGYRPSREEDPHNCFITRCLIRGAPGGPLSGEKVGLKDNIAVAGVPMTLGSRFMDGFVPDVDASVVSRLLEAGADIVGKLNMDDFSRAGAGFGTGIGGYGRCRNPHALDHLTGGSSSGSAAAVASGAVDLAIGGDQGGSIRLPAAWCGVVGLKPTHGLVPFTGVTGIEPSIDHIGPMGRTIEDVAAMLECIAGPDGYDSRQPDTLACERYSNGLAEGVRGVRIGLLREGFGGDEAEPDVDESVMRGVACLENAGAMIREITVAEHLACTSLIPALSTLGIDLLIRTCGGGLVRGFYDTLFAESFGRYLERRADLLPPSIKLSRLYCVSRGQRALDYYGKAQNVRRSFTRAYDRAFREVDCLVMPTVPIKAPRYNAPQNDLEGLRRSLLRATLRAVTRNTAPFDITGHPALSIPCGLSQNLPVGMMLVGPHFSDGMLLRIAYAYEQSVDWGSYFVTASPKR